MKESKYGRAALGGSPYFHITTVQLTQEEHYDRSGV